VLVEIWSDVVCPWCYIGKRRFEAGLAAFERRDEVEVVWRSYQLDPTAPAVTGVRTIDHLAAKYGVSRDEAETMQERVARAAEAEGLEYHLDRTQRGNSFEAHRLLHLAAEHGVQDDLEERLFQAYFTEGEAIGDPTVLERLATDVGLEPDEVAEVLAGDRFADDVREDEATARQLGCNGVPFFVIDRRFGISGAQPAEAFTEVLARAFEDVA
jgi:predicted DsbA family dithiol-disulfide isomerase